MIRAMPVNIKEKLDDIAAIIIPIPLYDHFRNISYQLVTMATFYPPPDVQIIKHFHDETQYYE